MPIFEIQKLVRNADGKLEGGIVATGNIPSFYQEIIDNKINFPASKFKRTVQAA